MSRKELVLLPTKGLTVGGDLREALVDVPQSIQGVTGGTDQTSGVFLMLNYTDITQNTYIQS